MVSRDPTFLIEGSGRVPGIGGIQTASDTRPRMGPARPGREPTLFLYSWNDCSLRIDGPSRLEGETQLVPDRRADQAAHRLVGEVDHQGRE